MGGDGLADSVIGEILTGTRRVAVVGASARADRPSHGVMAFLMQQGFDVTPVNPGLAGQTILGRRVVATLAEASPLEMVDVFRASEHVAPLMAEAIRIGARTVWLQLGVSDPAAEAAGRAAGLTVVVDRCPKIEWPRLGLRRRDRPDDTGGTA